VPGGLGVIHVDEDAPLGAGSVAKTAGDLIQGVM
jgi:hypothetical protein